MGKVQLRDNRRGKAVLLPPGQAGGAVAIVIPAAGGQAAATVAIEDALHDLTPESIISVLCAKERAFGSGRLPPLETA